MKLGKLRQVGKRRPSLGKSLRNSKKGAGSTDPLSKSKGKIKAELDIGERRGIPNINTGSGVSSLILDLRDLEKTFEKSGWKKTRKMDTRGKKLEQKKAERRHSCESN